MLTSNVALQGLVSSLAEMNQQQTTISQEMSSGVRLSSLGDDPVAAATAIRNADTLHRADSFIATANTVGNRMQAADSALSQVVTTLTSAIGTAVGAVNDSGSANRAAAAQQLTSIRETLLSLANSSYNGSYLFSGTGTAQPFTEAADGTVTYNGNTQTAQVPLLSGGSIPSSVTGSFLFTASTASVFGALNAIISNLNSSGTTDATTSVTLVGNLRDALANVTSQRAMLNTAQTRLSSESDYATAQKTNLSVDQTTLLGADTAALATQLSTVTTQRNALLSTISVVQKGSLFDYL